MSQDNRFRQTEGIEDIEASVGEADRDVRISAEEGDDLPVTLPDMQPRGTEASMTGDTEASESIEQRISQEEPDPTSAYGAPDDESGLDRRNRGDRVGGDDPDSIPVETDVLGDSSPAAGNDDGSDYGDIAPQYGVGDDEPAEEAAIRVEGDDELTGQDFGVDDGLDTEGDIDALVEGDS